MASSTLKSSLKRNQGVLILALNALFGKLVEKKILFTSKTKSHGKIIQ
jgi:hypothetical protein